MLEQVDLNSLPPPPASAVDWRERAIRVCDDMPGLRDELGNVPVGWFSLIEHAILEVRRCLPPGHSFHTQQLKEKFGTLRWYGHVESITGEAVGNVGVEGATEWAEDASAGVCAVLGTPDGRIDNTGGWLLTLSDHASSLRRESKSSETRANFGTLMYPRWED